PCLSPTQESQALHRGAPASDSPRRTFPELATGSDWEHPPRFPWFAWKAALSLRTGRLSPGSFGLATGLLLRPAGRRALARRPIREREGSGAAGCSATDG